MRLPPSPFPPPLDIPTAVQRAEQELADPGELPPAPPPNGTATSRFGQSQNARDPLPPSSSPGTPRLQRAGPHSLGPGAGPLPRFGSSGTMPDRAAPACEEDQEPNRPGTSAQAACEEEDPGSARDWPPQLLPGGPWRRITWWGKGARGSGTQRGRMNPERAPTGRRAVRKPPRTSWQERTKETPTSRPKSPSTAAERTFPRPGKRNLCSVTKLDIITPYPAAPAPLLRHHRRVTSSGPKERTTAPPGALPLRFSRRLDPGRCCLPPVLGSPGAGTAATAGFRPPPPAPGSGPSPRP